MEHGQIEARTSKYCIAQYYRTSTRTLLLLVEATKLIRLQRLHLHEPEETRGEWPGWPRRRGQKRHGWSGRNGWVLAVPKVRSVRTPPATGSFHGELDESSGFGAGSVLHYE